MKRLCIIIVFAVFGNHGFSQNPVLPVKDGMTDPHIHVYDGKAYMVVGHDSSINNKWFEMNYWAMYSSSDLVNWKREYTLHPEETFIGRPYNECWGSGFAKRNGRFYWYISQHNLAIGVMTATNPDGPWHDPLGHPLITPGTAPTDPYDPAIFSYAGDYYIVFGVWNFYIAKLNKDMISLAEKPRKIIINNPHGPYNSDGLNTKEPTDDKPNIHFYKGKFYLSWGAFYGMSDNLYGPYDYKDAIMNDASFAKGYKEPTWPKGFRAERHGSFFEMNHQWYFSYDDMSQTGNRFFRSSFISYVHYKRNGEIAPIRVDGTGVGTYDANAGHIEAEDYFNASKMCVQENNEGKFVVAPVNNSDLLVFPNIKGLHQKSKIIFNALVLKNVTIEVHLDSPKGKLLASYRINKAIEKNVYHDYVFDFPEQENTASLCFLFKGHKNDLMFFDFFQFK